jgi:hypothetical protein
MQRRDLCRMHPEKVYGQGTALGSTFRLGFLLFLELCVDIVDLLWRSLGPLQKRYRTCLLSILVNYDGSVVIGMIRKVYLPQVTIVTCIVASYQMAKGCLSVTPIP